MSEQTVHHERAIIGLTLLDPSIIDRFETELSKYDWIDDHCKTLWPILRKMNADKEPIVDTRNVAVKTKGLLSIAELVRLISDAGFPGQDQYHLSYLSAEIEKKRLRKVAFDIQRLVDDPSEILDQIVDKAKFNHWKSEVQPKPTDCDPFPMPKMLFQADGIIKLFVDYAVSTAPRPRPELALANALAMIGVITGRKIRNKSGLRTNIYMIGLAESGSGKDWSRKCCREIFSVATMQDYLAAENPASGAALVTAIHEHPSSLFQIDEINRYFASIKNAGR